MTFAARLATFVGGLLAVSTLLACDPSRPIYGEGEGEGEGEGDGDGPNPNPDAWFVMGQGESGWDEVKEGDALRMVLGGQGLLMFPMPVRAKGFTLPDNPQDYNDPKVPVLNIHLDIEGYNIGFGGHFSRIANYPLPFTVLDDGTYEFIYVTIFVPDALADPCEIDGLPGSFEARLRTADGDTLRWDRNVIIEIPDILCG